MDISEKIQIATSVTAVFAAIFIPLFIFFGQVIINYFNSKKRTEVALRMLINDINYYIRISDVIKYSCMNYHAAIFREICNGKSGFRDRVIFTETKDKLEIGMYLGPKSANEYFYILESFNKILHVLEIMLEEHDDPDDETNLLVNRSHRADQVIDMCNDVIVSAESIIKSARSMGVEVKEKSRTAIDKPES